MLFRIKMVLSSLMCISLLLSFNVQLFGAPTDSNTSRVVKKKEVEKSKQSKQFSLTKKIKKRWDMQHVHKQKLPVGWTSVNGQWAITTEPEHPTNKVLQQVQLKRAKQQLVTKADYANFDLSVRLRADSFKQKTKNWQMGILFRMVDENHYYKCRITAANIALIRYAMEHTPIIPASQGTTSVAGATGKRAKANEQVLLILPIGSQSDHWHTLEVQCYGERISIKLNDREVRSLSDAGIGAGKISIYTYKTQAFIDDLKLSYLPLPRSDHAIVPIKNVYSPRKDGGLIIYYKLEQSGLIDLSVTNSKGDLFAQLSDNYHAKGLNTVVWYGQGIFGKQPRPGQYTIILKANKKISKSTITIK